LGCIPTIGGDPAETASWTHSGCHISAVNALQAKSVRWIPMTGRQSY